ncbi:MAG: IclR family transcriptional regulator [Acidimicrobiales bacterium]
MSDPDDLPPVMPGDVAGAGAEHDPAGRVAAPGGTGANGAEPSPPDGTRVTRRADFVQSLERGLAVIRAFGPERSRLTLTEVAHATGLTRAAARRFLLTLTELGYVRSDGREFSLRPRVLELGYAYLSGMSLPEVAQPHMEELVARVRESSSISVLDGNDVVYVVRVPTSRIMTVAISIGTRFPAYCTSMGRVLVAEKPGAELDRYLGEVELVPRTRRTVTDPAALRCILGEVRHQGYALVEQELEDGLNSIAVPIRDGGKSVVAAMNVSANALRVDRARLVGDVLPALRETAGQIEEGLRAAGRSATTGGARNLRGG